MNFRWLTFGLWAMLAGCETRNENMPSDTQSVQSDQSSDFHLWCENDEITLPDLDLPEEINKPRRMTQLLRIVPDEGSSGEVHFWSGRDKVYYSFCMSGGACSVQIVRNRITIEENFINSADGQKYLKTTSINRVDGSFEQTSYGPDLTRLSVSNGHCEKSAPPEMTAAKF